MAKGSKLAPEEVEELFSKIDASGVVRSERSEPAVDPLSDEDPSGSKVASSISRMGIAFIAGIIIFVVGMQVGYGVMRRLNTANLSDTVTTETVSRALEGGVEWGNGFTQFPAEFTVEEADELTGVVEVSVVSAEAENELELFSNSQIEAAALATNALLNDNINRVVYNVSAYVDEDGNIVAGNGEGQEARLVFTFIWTKNKSEASSNIDWGLRIVGMDEEIAGRIQTQVNSVSSLIETPSVDDADIDAHERELQSAQEQKGEELYLGDDGGATLDAARERAQEDASASH
ncbi:hypothetical protein [uncultured Enorma sp.]|uniref:hypothetical protein n=1 Tax=uncultured Enorma sp. TaxID=1714346 RepID=UPI002805013F|nr:hypothetical protein [uncultured Enorma sp.]